MIDPGGSPIDPPSDDGAVVPATLDRVALAKLHELDPDGRRGVVSRVMTAFDSSLGRWLTQLEGQPDPVDPAAVGSIVHTLKSSAGSVGAKDLALACAQIEQRLRHGEPVNLPLEVQRLVTLGHAAQAAIRAMLRP